MSNTRKPDIKDQEQIKKLLSKGNLSEILGRGKWKNLFAQVDISSIVFFRIIFGMIMFVEVFRYFDRIERYWILPKYHFHYLPFDFISPLQGNGMYLVFILMGILSLFIIVGFFYRFSIILFWICFTYSFLLEQTRYLNHFYLIILVSFVMIFIPANSSASIDRRIFKKAHSETSPVWLLWLLRFMIAIPYFFGGISKLNSDWLQGEPMRMWLTKNIHASVFGNLFQYESMILFIVYSGLILDLFIVPLLLYKKTRTLGFILITIFHLVNADLFNIGIFPWFMIAATTIYFDPDWPRKVVNYFSRKNNRWPMIAQSKETLLAPAVLSKKQKMILTGLSIWVTIQVLVPLRHFFIPGNVYWTEEGQKFAWQMKLRTKSGKGSFIAKDKNSGAVYPINVNEYLRSSQRSVMQDRPNLIWQFCQIVREDFKKKGIDAAVYANIKASLNGRKYKQLTDSTVDLASVPFDYFSHSEWIIPLITPLDDRLNEKKDSDGENGNE